MPKVIMTIKIYSDNAVKTSFSGSTVELTQCNRALTKHIKEQAKSASALSYASTYVDPVALKNPVMTPETRDQSAMYPRRPDARNMKGAGK